MTEGLLHGIRVVEFASAQAAMAGKMMADMGADVVVVEPPGGHASRRFGPFADGIEDPEHSLWWWAYNTSKRGVALDLRTPEGLAKAKELISRADLVLDGEEPGQLAALGIAYADVWAAYPDLVWVSVTPFGSAEPRSGEPATDLTLLASGGAVWSCGYDDHTLAPVRGGGNQAYLTASIWAVMGGLAAVTHRMAGGRGQHVDVSINAAVNVTTEQSTMEWLVAKATVQRQTGRHASTIKTAPCYAVAADGQDVHTGFPPRSAAEFSALLEWLSDLGLRDSFDDAILLQMGIEKGGIQMWDVGRDPLETEIFRAARDGLMLIAQTVSAREFFIGTQNRGLACAIVNAPEDVLNDPHFIARGFPTPVVQDQIGRMVVHAGAPFKAPAAPWRISRRAPLVGEHNDPVLAQGDDGGIRWGR